MNGILIRYALRSSQMSVFTSLYGVTTQNTRIFSKISLSILPFSELLRSLRWTDIDVSGLPTVPTFKD